MAVITLHVPEMTCRRLVRVVTARVRDLPGVEMVEANVDTAVLVVHGTATERQVCVALAEAGFPASGEPGR
jgi:copper chaperone CopZ